jgi:hypothetical protein
VIRFEGEGGLSGRTLNDQWLSDAHFNEELSSAVAAALLHSPTEVLRRFGSDMCHEPDHLPAACDVSRWPERVRTSLAGVQDPNVAEIKIKCEQVLRTGM